MSTALATCLELAGKLDAHELSELGKTVSALKMGAPEAGDTVISTSVASPAVRILDALAAKLNDRGIILPNRKALHTKAREADVVRKAERLDGYLKRQHADARVRRSILMLGIELMLDQIEQRATMPLTFNYAANCLHLIPGLFDVSFPGYGNAGLLGIVVQRESAPAGQPAF